jgi:hypothetical protein
LKRGSHKTNFQEGKKYEQTFKNRKLYQVLAILLLTVMWVAAPFILNGDKTQAEEMLILSDTRHYASLTGFYADEQYFSERPFSRLRQFAQSSQSTSISRTRQ